MFLFFYSYLLKFSISQLLIFLNFFKIVLVPEELYKWKRADARMPRKQINTTVVWPPAGRGVGTYDCQMFAA